MEVVLSFKAFKPGGKCIPPSVTLKNYIFVVIIRSVSLVQKASIILPYSTY